MPFSLPPPKCALKEAFTYEVAIVALHSNMARFATFFSAGLRAGLLFATRTPAFSGQSTNIFNLFQVNVLTVLVHSNTTKLVIKPSPLPGRFLKNFFSRAAAAPLAGAANAPPPPTRFVVMAAIARIPKSSKLNEGGGCAAQRREPRIKFRQF